MKDWSKMTPQEKVAELLPKATQGMSDESRKQMAEAFMQKIAQLEQDKVNEAASDPIPLPAPTDDDVDCNNAKDT